jgi:hypothetical protein
VLVGRRVRAVTGDIDLVWMATSPAAAAAAAAAAAGAGGTDYALLRCRQALGDGRVAVVLRSITCDHVPPTPTHRRAELLPSGFLLTPARPAPSTAPGGGGGGGGGGTVVEYMVQLDRMSAAQFDRELAGRSGLLRTSLVGLAAAAAAASAAAAAAAAAAASDHDPGESSSGGQPPAELVTGPAPPADSEAP